MKRSSSRPAVLATAAAALTLLCGALQLQSASAAPAPAGTAASGGPGASSYFDLARKDCLGTAENTASKVWYTVGNGELENAFSPETDPPIIPISRIVPEDWPIKAAAGLFGRLIVKLEIV